MSATHPYGSGPEQPQGGPQQPGNAQGQPDPPVGNSFFRWIRSLNMYRSSNRWIGGVSGAIAGKLGWDPVIIRILFFAFCIAGGSGVFVYAILWIFLPDSRNNEILAEEALFRGHTSRAFWAALVAILLGGGLNIIMPFIGWIGVAVLCCLIVMVSLSGKEGRDSFKDRFAQSDRQGQPSGRESAYTPYTQNDTAYHTYPYQSNPNYYQGAYPMNNRYTEPSRPYAAWRRKTAGPVVVSIVLGLLIIAFGVYSGIVYYQGLDFFSALRLGIIFCTAAVLVLGAVIIVLGIRGRKAGGLMPISIICAVIMLSILGTFNSTADIHSSLVHPVQITLSTRTLGPDSYDNLVQHGLKTSSSNVTVDLRDWASARQTACPTGTLNVEAYFSKINIRVPDGCAVQYQGKHAVAGSVEGSGLPRGTTLGKDKTLTVNASAVFSGVTASPSPRSRLSGISNQTSNDDNDNGNNEDWD